MNEQLFLWKTVGMTLLPWSCEKGRRQKSLLARQMAMVKIIIITLIAMNTSNLASRKVCAYYQTVPYKYH
jgi:hypothetical protein